MKDQGVDFGPPDVNLKKLEEWKQGVVSRLTGGVAQLLKANKVELIEGEAVFESAGSIRVGEKSYSAATFIIATGSSPISIPGFEVENVRIVDSTGALVVSEVPKRFLAIGGSAIGLEFADIYSALGSEVTVVELMDRIVPSADPGASRGLQRALKKRGLNILTGTGSVSQKKVKGGMEVTREDSKGERSTRTGAQGQEAVGRRPNTQD